MVNAFPAHLPLGDEAERDSLGEHGRDRRRRRAGDTPAADEDEHRVERDVERVAGEVHPEDKPGAAAAGEVRRRRHLQVDRVRARHGDREVVPLQRQRLCPWRGQREQMPAERHERQREERGGERDELRRAVDVAALLVVARAVADADQHRGVADDGLEETREDPHQHPRRQHRLERSERTVREIRAVDELHDRVVHHPERQRPHETDYLRIRLCAAPGTVRFHVEMRIIPNSAARESKFVFRFA